ncbi:MAG: DNA polymerase I [Alphaproteobacteria bacterium]|nr:DNA polymerase I [Alphaproteobacteria bacterium]
MGGGLKNKKVVLIDGSGYIYRAFYALPSMTRSDGVPVNAVYGFCAMLMKLIKEMPADYLAVMFDTSRHTFRMDLFPDYKGTRKEVPEELVPQFPLLRQAVDAFGIAQSEMAGFEADDLLATYARLAHEEEAEVTIVSADKDLMQLVGTGITIYDPIKQRVVGAEQVFEKFGVTPDKVIDVQALAGDTSDNVPGVRGIGIKTAAALINEYGSLENLLDNAASIKQNKRREVLTADANLARLSKKLVTLNAFAPVEKPLADFVLTQPDLAGMQAFFTEMGFKSLMGKLASFEPAAKGEHGAVVVPDLAVPTMPVVPKVEKQYALIQEAQELARQLKIAEEKGVLAIDTETDSLLVAEAQMVGFSFCYEEGKAFYVPLRHKPLHPQTDLFGNEDAAQDLKQIPLKEALALLKPVLENPGILKIGHNIKFDWHVFANEYDSLNMASIEDTMVLSYDLDGAAHLHNMDDLAALFLDCHTIKYRDVCGTGRGKISFDKVDLQTALDYAAEDADVTLRLYHLFKKRLENEKLVSLYELFDRPCISILYDMEREGIKVCQSELKKLSADFGAKQKVLEQKVHLAAGEEFNLNSPLQLGKVLFEKLNLPKGVKNKKTGSWATEAALLEELADDGFQIARDILEYRQFTKLKNTYTDALQEQINPKTGRVHTTFMQTVASTGRLSSNDPNLQNIPIRQEEGRAIRRAFIAESGKLLLSADYSQIELRLMAHVADVKALKDAFASGADIHAATASQIFGVPIEGMDPMIRRRAKAINFGIIYGISAFGLARQLGIERREAQEYINSYFAKYPEIKSYMEETIYFARSNGFVMTPFGRKCSVGSINDKNAARRQFAERAAVNAPIQGGAADIIKKAMLRVGPALKEAGLSAKLLLQVHDELILEMPEKEAEETAKVVKNVMESVFTLSVPLIAEVGIADNWANAH